MSGVSKPTPEDMARDGLADLAVCDAAPPGPWYALDSSHEINDHSDACWMVLSPHPDDVADALAFGEHGVDEIPDVAVKTFEFLALSRLALPAWVARARHAEAVNAALLAASQSMLLDVHNYKRRGGKLTDAEEHHVNLMRAAVAQAKGD